MSDALRLAANSLDTLRQTFSQLNAPQIGCRVFSAVGEVRCPDGFAIAQGEDIEAERMAMMHFGSVAPSEALRLPDNCPGLDELAEEFRFAHSGEPIRIIRPRPYFYTLFATRKLTMPDELAEFRAAESAIGRLAVAAEAASGILATVPLDKLPWLDPRTPLASGLYGGLWFNAVFDLAARGLVGIRAPRQRVWRRGATTYQIPWEPHRLTLNGDGGTLDLYKEILDFYDDGGLPDVFQATVPDFALASALAAGALADDLRRLTDEPPQPPPAAVVLGCPNDEPTVRGKRKAKLPAAQFNVVKAMLGAGRPLTKDELDEKSGHTDARKILKTLADSDPDWRAVIHFAGKPGGRYRIG